MAGRHRKPPSKGGHGRHRRPPQRRRLVAPALGSVLLLGAGGIAAAAAITGGGGTGGGGTDVHATQTPSAAQRSAPTVTPLPTSPAPSPSSTTAPPRRRPPAALAIRTTGRVSWVEVTRPSGRVVYSGMLRHGRAVVVRGGPATAVIGDAGAVRLSRHGRVADPAGRPGEVRVVTVR